MNLAQRLVGVFVSPGKVFEWLAREPKWVGAFLATAALAVLAQVLIPADLQLEAMRTAMLERGMDMSEADMERAASISRVAAPIGGFVFISLFMLVAAGILTVLFGFLLGDEGTFKQRLAATTHAFVIASVGSLAVTPLRIMSGDPQMMISPGRMLGGLLGDGYLQSFLGMIDVFGIWSLAVLAIAMTRIDTKRDFPMAFGVLLGVQLTIIAVIAIFV